MSDLPVAGEQEESVPVNGVDFDPEEAEILSELQDSVRPAHERKEGQRLVGRDGSSAGLPSEDGGAGEAGVLDQAKRDVQYGAGNKGIGPLELGEDNKYKFAWEPTTYNKETFWEMLRQLAAKGVDDVKLRSQLPIAAKLHSRVHKVGRTPLSLDGLSQLVSLIHLPTTAAKVRMGTDRDFSISVPLDREKQLRFRANLTAVLGLYGARDGLELTLRTIPPHPPTMDNIGIPQEIRDFAFPDSGIILLTGETGSGKTTTLGSFVRHLAEDEDGKVIITFESPIEFDYNALPEVTGTISQTEIGTHLESYRLAVRNMLRRNGDVLLFGEARDEETIMGATLASQTGHAVYTTVHTNNVSITISRMVNDCAPDQQTKVATALCDSVRGIINQRLLKTPDKKGRTLVLSYLGIDNQMRNTLLKTKPEDIPSVMNKFVESYGMPIRVDLENKFREGLILKSDYERVMAEVS